MKETSKNNYSIFSVIILFFILTVFSISGKSIIAFAETITENLEPTILAHFDSSPRIDEPRSLPHRVHGGKIIPDGVVGPALRLSDGEFLEIDVKGMITSRGGTLMFWVRPQWGYYQHEGDNLISHTFASMKWEDNRNGYFVLSDGWWEPAGSLRTYFVANNKDYAHTSQKMLYRANQWYHFACTWKAGNPGEIHLYCDGVLLSSNGKFNGRLFRANDKLYIGSDQGTPLANERYANSDFDELAVFNEALSEDQIKSIYETQSAVKPIDKMAWLNEVLSKPYNPSRTSNGELLETRAIFDEGTGWMTPSGAFRTIKRIKKAGFNVYIPCIWHGRGTRYPSKVAPSENNNTWQDDPLARLIKIAHSNGIEVHPWFTVALRQREFLTSYYDKNTPQKAFDVHRPAFRSFVVNLITDVAKRYDVDGINLDYIRTMGLCKCAYCTRSYQTAYGRSLVADSNNKQPNGALEPHLQDWQNQSIEIIVRQVSENIKSINPNLILSVDGHPVPEFLPPNAEGRNEVAWANSGLVDMIFSMDYSLTPDFQLYDIIRNSMKNPLKISILIANYERIDKDKVIPKNSEKLSRLIKYIQNKYYENIGIYLYSQLNDDQISDLKNSNFYSLSKPIWQITEE